jgi:hypothetical protein
MLDTGPGEKLNKVILGSEGYEDPLNGIGGVDGWVLNKATKQTKWQKDIDLNTLGNNMQYLGTRYQGLYVNQYEQYQDPQYGGSTDGILISLGYKDKKTKKEYRWVQTVRTNVSNHPNGDTVYNDPPPPDDDGLPFYYTNSEVVQFKNKRQEDILFEDRPQRPVKGKTNSGVEVTANNIRWFGELSLVEVNEGKLNVVLTISYGFIIINGKSKILQMKISKPSAFQQASIKNYRVPSKKVNYTLKGINTNY